MSRKKKNDLTLDDKVQNSLTLDEVVAYITQVIATQPDQRTRELATYHFEKVIDLLR